MMDNEKDQEMDVRSVVEAVSADHPFGAPLYVVESMCMRCGENVCLSFSHCHTCGWLVVWLCLKRSYKRMHCCL